MSKYIFTRYWFGRDHQGRITAMYGAHKHVHVCAVTPGVNQDTYANHELAALGLAEGRRVLLDGKTDDGYRFTVEAPHHA